MICKINTEILCCSSDLKLFKKIHSVRGCIHLLKYIDNIDNWFKCIFYLYFFFYTNWVFGLTKSQSNYY